MFAFKISSLLIFLDLVYGKIELDDIVDETSNGLRNHPNIIIFIVEDLRWSEIGYHVYRQKDTENATPNIDALAFSGIILNRFYANGGYKSLVTGQYDRLTSTKYDLMKKYFTRNCYKVDHKVMKTLEEIERYERELLEEINSSYSPFLLIAHFAMEHNQINIQNIDEFSSALVSKLSKTNQLNNTILFFMSIEKKSLYTVPLESKIRRAAFIYSPLLQKTQWVSHYLFHISDILPTLLNAANISLTREEHNEIEGIDQWKALNRNEEIRKEVFGDNFYLNQEWKIAFSHNKSFDSKQNLELNGNNELNKSQRSIYLNSIFNSEVVQYLDSSFSQHSVLSLSKRAKVFCNSEINEFVELVCSRNSPCLFDAWNDPCEVDNYAREEPYKLDRDYMMGKLDGFLRGEPVKDLDNPNILDQEVIDHKAAWKIGVILGGSVMAGIFIFIIVVCVKEKCNTKRSVYDKNVKFIDQSGARTPTAMKQDIAIVSDKV